MKNWSEIKRLAVANTEEEFQLWSSGGLKEWDTDATPILEKYWRSVKSPSAATAIVDELQSDPDHLEHPWSAAFISWVMGSAGATMFRNSSAHRVYVAEAKRNRENNVIENPFWAYRIHEAKPAVGDLICQRRCTEAEYHSSAIRPKKCATYENIDLQDADGNQIPWRIHCDIVTKVRNSSIEVIGGNVKQSVSKKIIPLDADGYIRKKPVEENQFISVIKFRDAPATMNVDVQLDTTSGALNSGPARREHFEASDEVIEFLEVAGGGLNRQVRIYNGDLFGLFTLKNRFPGSGIRIGPSGLERLGIDDASEVTLTIDTRVTSRTLSKASARSNSELIERIKGNGSNVATLAPHGGAIEPYTDQQAYRLFASLGGNVARCWRCFGWNEDQGASDCWHITSTEVSENSFPLLNEMFDRQYLLAVAFHGWSREYVGVGGSAQPQRDQVVLALQGILPGIDVRIEQAGELSGSNIHNIVNRLSPSSIQIEQPMDVRRSHWAAIADAVFEVIQ
jgi:phage replication-related protein YjqB (UPF0714/DUF867 family)